MHGVGDEDYAAAARVLRLAGLPVVACGPAVAEGLAEQDLAVVTTIPNGVPPAMTASQTDRPYQEGTLIS